MRLFVLLVVVASTLALDLLEHEWTAYKVKHNKHYGVQEDPYRRGLFLETKKMVEEHNRRHAAGLVDYNLAVNHFADMTEEEAQHHVSCLSGAEHFDGPSYLHRRPKNALVPDEIDWRTKGAVTDVKSQGMCGACWAFSAICSLEGQNYLKNGNLVELSEQNLVDCDERDYQCNGGWVSTAFQYIQKNGVDTESSYPYESIDGVARSCRYKKDTVGATVSGIVNIKTNSEEDLEHAVATIGPVSVAIDASGCSFHKYGDDGVYYNQNCSSVNLNHAVTVVGYGTEDGKDYWLVKNSWGTNWGRQGYIKMARNKNNHCGIATNALYPVVP